MQNICPLKIALLLAKALIPLPVETHSKRCMFLEVFLSMARSSSLVDVDGTIFQGMCLSNSAHENGPPQHLPLFQ